MENPIVNIYELFDPEMVERSNLPENLKARFSDALRLAQLGETSAYSNFEVACMLHMWAAQTLNHSK